MAEQAVFATPEDHPDRAGRLSNLADGLANQYNRTRNINDLEAAISKAELAASSTLNQNRAGTLKILGNMLFMQFIQTGNMDDLEAAISKLEVAISITPEDHSSQAAMKYDLGFMLRVRFDQTKSLDNLQVAVKLFIRSFNVSCAVPLYRVITARSALRILASMEIWGLASVLAQAAIELLPYVFGRYLSHDDQKYATLQISGLAADACSFSLKVGNVHRALQQLEFGRGIIFGYLMDSRSDLTKLQTDYPHLANEYDALRFKAYVDIETKKPVIHEQLLNERREVAIRLEECLHRIRLKNGYERFSLEPTLKELNRVLMKDQLSL